MTSPYRRLLLPIYAPSMLMAVGQQAVLILLPLYALHLGGGASWAAAILGFRGLGAWLADVPAGLAAARFGDKAVMLVGLGLLSVAGLALSVVENLPMLAAVALLYGMGMSNWLLGRISYVTDTCAIDERGRAVSVMAGIQRTGTFLGPAIGGYLAQNVGYDVAFLAAGISAVAAAVIVVLFTANVHGAGAGEQTHLATITDIVITHRRVLITAGGAALALTLMRAARLLLVPVWGTSVGLDAAQIGLLYSLSVVVELAMFYHVGIAMDSRGRKSTAVPCMALLALSLALLPTVSGFYSLLAVSLLAGVGNGFGTGLVLTLGSDFAPATRRGEFLGVWRLTTDSGLAAGPFLIGGLAQVTTLAFATIATAGVGLIGLAVMILCVEDTLANRLQR